MAPDKRHDGEFESSPLQQQKGADHVVSHRHRLSLKQYPRDCPPLRPQWFHAVDVPKRRPNPAGDVKTEKPLTAPKKYSAFSKTDSKAIEAAFQKLVEEEDGRARAQLEQQRGDSARLDPDAKPRSDNKPNLSLRDDHKPSHVKVPVNEDYLFDVDVEKRELAPAYWLGPVYDVRRGTWFYQDGSVQRPCDENLAAQLEEGYLKVKAWRLPSAQVPKTKPRSASQPRSRPSSWAPGHDGSTTSQPISAKPSQSDLRKRATEETDQASENESSQSTHRLFGAHMNSVVTYQDATTAWLLTDDFMSRMNYTMYQRFAGGGHFAGMKMTRGYINPDKKTETKESKNVEGNASAAKAGHKDDDDNADAPSPRQASSEMMRQTLTRHMSSLLDDPSGEDPAKQDEEMRKRAEREIEDDYRETEGDDQGREIEHLILVTHGIGQRLGLRLESVNFVHDVNTLRKTLKAVYADSPDLRALNAELEESETLNSRIQVLPINWRQKLQFPKQSLRHWKEHDLADTDFDEEEYPTLDDISVDGVPAVRNLLTDLALDILLYESPIYKQHISSIVVQECNRIYELWMKRNPGFNGKISLVGHSLGSAIFFDILSRQDQEQGHGSRRKTEKHLKLDFEVEDFYALGSPIGLFQMLGGRTIAARPSAATRINTSTSMDDPMFAPVPSRKTGDAGNALVSGEMPVSRPKCSQVFNIFHPTDPISYRIEPLISPAMASLKPQPLPYTKRGIFGAPVGQGLTGIGARVSQSVSSMWSSMASSLLTRGLGYNDEPRQASGNGQAATKSSGPLFVPNVPNTSSGQNNSGGSSGFAPAAAPLPPEGTEIVKITTDSAAKAADQHGLHPATLIDAELETLYGGYEKRRKSVQSDAVLRDLGAGAIGSAEWAEAEERGKRLRREEEKVRRLNSNGRVDYCIQESAWDINLISAIASHLSYWSDEDTSHFMLSQLLSRHRIVQPRKPSSGGSSSGSGSSTQQQGRTK